MKDVISEITSKLDELKKRDGLDGISMTNNRVGCNIRLTRGLLDASGTGRNFGIAYTSAIKRLNQEHDNVQQ